MRNRYGISIYAGTKKEIEKNGVMVIEFKRQMISTEKVLNNVSNVLQELMRKIINVINPIVEKLCEIFDKIRLIIDEVREITGYQTSRRYKLCKILSKYTGIEKRKLWKMTRHPWLARRSI